MCLPTRKRARHYPCGHIVIFSTSEALMHPRPTRPEDHMRTDSHRHTGRQRHTESQRQHRATSTQKKEPEAHRNTYTDLGTSRPTSRGTSA